MKKKDINKPNIILCMTDDQGWGDTGYNGHEVLKTPNLDQMAAEGICFDRFYAGAPVCSPTRGSCLTGRHPFRYGIFYACTGHMRSEEITLAEALKTQNYRTGHFGKWHLGTLTTTKEQNRWGPWKEDPIGHYSPPWENGFDVCFSTESKVPTWNPMIIPEGWGTGEPGERFGNDYWIGEDEIATDNLEGDDSRIIMDRALPFIKEAAQEDEPFLAVIWFHTPHSPVVAGSKYKKMYSDLDVNKQHYYGCITAMDEQVGRLRNELKQLGVADNTMLWFCSDNGPAAEGGGPGDTAGGRQQGTSGSYRGRKGSLYEGGVRVPGLLVWPNKIKQDRRTDLPCSTLDYFPTIMDVLGFEMEGQPEPIDGISLLPIIEGEDIQERPFPIGFESKKQMALTDNRYKLISTDEGESYSLYDLLQDPAETNDIADQNPDIVDKMEDKLKEWRQSCQDSFNGNDF